MNDSTAPSQAFFAGSPKDGAGGFHLMTKPMGPICNLHCQYCFYLEKTRLYPGARSFRMPDDLLEENIRQYIAAQDAPEIQFAWQGGEPTLLGVEFFRRVVELQARHCPPGKRVLNALQTNGTLLDEEWCEFLRANRFLVGISLDGPRELHDHYRVDKGGHPTFERVMAGLTLLRKHGVEFNTLTVVHRLNAQHPLEVYRFLKRHGSGHLQFIPLVERKGQAGTLGEPPSLSGSEESEAVTAWSVSPEAWGDFLCAIFDEWVRHDVGRVFVQLFEVQLAVWMGLPSSLCIFAETCGRALAMEHNGDLYACDHFVYPRYLRGNLREKTMTEMVASAEQIRFGADKRDRLPRYCRRCDVRFACNGECPKRRFLRAPDGEPGLNYLCAGYKKFFKRINPAMRALAQLVSSGRPASQIMGDRRNPLGHAPKTGRNHPCPCGSGGKFKACCGATSKPADP